MIGWRLNNINKVGNNKNYENIYFQDRKIVREIEVLESTKISEVWKNVGDKMMMLFDYGDDWRFVVELLGFGPSASLRTGKSAKAKYPRVLKTVGIAPEQYPDYE